jgi:hypothetical protein
VPATLLGSSLTQLLEPRENQYRTLGFGERKLIERLRTIRDQDPDVNRIITRLVSMFGSEPSVTSPSLSAELRVPGSTSREVFNAYLAWVGHRGVKDPGDSQQEQERRRALDPALMTPRMGAIIDLIVARIVDLDLPIPDEAAVNLLVLFQGGAERIQIRAETFMINDKIGDLYDTEKALASEVALPAETLFDAVKTLIDMDGVTPFFGFKPPLKPGEERLVGGQKWVKYGQPPPEVSSSALMPVSDSVIATVQRDATINVLQQSPSTRIAVSRIENRLSEMNPSTEEYSQCVDLLGAYSKAIRYDSRKLWASQGLVDKLVEVSILKGTQNHREQALCLLYDGIEKIRGVISKSFGSSGVLYLDIYRAVSNLVLGRESWDEETLDFVFEKIVWLQSFNSPLALDTREASKIYEQVLQVRRNEHPDATQLLQALQRSGSESQIISYGPYSVQLTVRTVTARGTPGKVLELCELDTTLPYDTEFYETLRRLETIASQHGFTAIQLSDWRNIHQSQAFRDAGEYEEIPPQKPIGQSSSINYTPTFVKALHPQSKAAPLQERGTFQEYIRNRFIASELLDLSSESEVLGEEAHRYKQQHGGKYMGQELLRRLLGEFGEPRLQTIPDCNVEHSQLANGIDLPPTILNNELGSTQLIARSNAAFEYGCPPGILHSRGLIPMPSDGKLHLDCEQMHRAFAQVLLDNNLDSRTSFRVLLQPQLSPRAGGIIYSSFAGRSDEPVIIEASLGSSVSATVGLANLIHYRVAGSQISTYRNFSGEVPAVIFHGKTCYIDPVECDPSRRELDLYKSVTPNLQPLRGKQLASVWKDNTFELESEPHSPLKREELELLSRFAKFAERRLNKPLKFEFGIAENGQIYLLQLDPAMLEVSDTALNVQYRNGDLLLETPFVNMPFNADGLHVIVEAIAGIGSTAPKEPFIFVSETTPLNINIQNELAGPYPHCAGIVAANGSRMNHCYSEARTFIPFIGCVGLRDKLREAFPSLTWGYNTGLKLDIRCDGRSARLRFYEVNA